jgi:hypothetical protein
MIKLPDVQYFHQIRKGTVVKYGNGEFRTQQEGNRLYIVITEKGVRTKKTITKDMFFEAGTMADYVFNEWFKIYTPEEFLSYDAA